MKSGIVFMVLVLLVSVSGCYAGVQESPKMVDAFLVVNDLNKARENINGEVHVFPEKNILIGRFSSSDLKSRYVEQVYYFDSKNIPDLYEHEFLLWKDSLEYKNTPLDVKLADIPSVEPIYNDLIIEEKPSLNDLNVIPARMPYGADPTDTSSYMIGDITVSVIFPESNSNSPNTEDWTDQEIQDVESEIFNAMDWWAVRNPDAALTFVYNFEERIPTDVEPIQNGYQYSWFWIADVMLNLGYGPEQYPPTPLVYDYINSKRGETDWGFVIFVVDSSNDVDGKFSDGNYAYTITKGDGSGGGPYMVVTYDNGNYGITNMDAVTAHESGHIFGALDEYGTCICTSRTGYLYYENQNCQNSCLINEDSIMRGGITPFTLGLIDSYAKGQIGWQDTDSDSILDIVDTNPGILLNQFAENENGFYFDGDSWVNIFSAVNPYYNDVTINTITDVSYRYKIEGEPWGGWFVTNPIDGLFDGPEELYDFILSGLGSGDYIIQSKAQNRFGNENISENQSITITGIPLCSESDGGLDKYNFGVTVDNFGSYEDSCLGSILYEYYCDGSGTANVEEIDCLYGCSLGKCNAKQESRKTFSILNE